MRLNEIINQIIRDSDGNEFRVINVDYIDQIVSIINVNEKSLPTKINFEDIICKINDKVIEILDDDIYTVIVKEEDLNDLDKEFRNKAINIINPILKSENLNLYDVKSLNKLLQKSADENKISKRTVKRYLIRYLVRGQNRNALLPDYYKSGGESQDKKLKNKKIGRPKKYNKDSGEGINVTEEIKLIFKKSIKKFYNNKSRKKLTKTYELMIAEYFKDDEGKIKPQNELPTLNQFRYWYKKEKSIKTEVISRHGEKKYNLNVRPLIGTSLQDASYPTAMFQIDSTQGDVNLVSSFNRNNKIGRPTIYIVIDVYSRMITGFYAGLQNASWSCVMTAIYNCTVDKVDLCKRYGINISENEWNSKDLPEALLCDKGSELTGKNIDSLANIFNIEIKNTPSYRADLKGIVENVFSQINDDFKQFVPGSIKSPIKERGEIDDSDLACLDINQINKIIIHHILNHNNKYMKNYKRDKGMIEDNIMPKPVDIWEWGMKNKVGYKPRFKDNIIKLGLMPRAQARVTDRGIKFKNMYYICDKAIKEEWLENARLGKTWLVDISYDPRNMNNIYITKQKSSEYEICVLKESENRYLDRTYDEIDNLIISEKKLASENEYDDLLNNIKKNNGIQEEVKVGQAITKDYQDKVGEKKKNTKQRRANRKKDRDILAKVEAFNISTESINHQADEYVIENINPISNLDTTFSDNDIENIDIENLLKQNKKRKNKMRKQFQQENINK